MVIIMGNNRIYLADWSIDGDRVKLVYSDEDIIYVKKVDFDRAFGAIVNACLLYTSPGADVSVSD